MSSICSSPVVSCRSASLGYADTAVLRIDHLDIAAGEVVGVLGASGAGKSTLLGALMGADVVRSGSVRLQAPDGTPVRVGFVPQITAGRFDPLCVAEVVALGAVRHGLRTTKEERRHVGEILDQLGLAGYARRRLDELSGGQRQRVAIARALVRKPTLLLCDEPTSGADPVLAAEIVEVLTGVSGATTAIVVATHDIAVVAPRMNRILGLANGTLVVDCAADALGASEIGAVYGSAVVR